MILIIDDDQEYSSELRTLLIRSGHSNVSTATTLSEGLAAATSLKPEVVILDLMLPISPSDSVGPRFPNKNEEAAGVGLARRLKEKGFNLNRIITITTLSSEKDLKPLNALGIEMIFSKPVSFQTILEAIREVLAKESPESL